VLAGKSPVNTTVHICHCRDRMDALNTELAPSSIVVIGGKPGWWPTAERRIAKKLRNAGHHVIMAGTPQAA
jgi:hypothetical protein